MNEVTTFNFESQKVRTVAKDSDTWFVLADVCKILELSTPSKVADRLDTDEKGMSLIHTLKGNQKMTIINESGLYAVILRSDKPQAKPFRKWVTSEVLPAIRKNGEYSTNAGIAYKRQVIETKERNSRARLGNMYFKLAKLTSNENYRSALIARCAEVLNNGIPFLPYPEIGEITYSAEQIGEKLGISAQKVGRLTNAYNLKTEEFGQWVWDKAKSADKQVQTFRYYSRIIPVLEFKLTRGL